MYLRIQGKLDDRQTDVCSCRLSDARVKAYISAASPFPSCPSIICQVRLSVRLC